MGLGSRAILTVAGRGSERVCACTAGEGPAGHRVRWQGAYAGVRLPGHGVGREKLEGAGMRRASFVGVVVAALFLCCANGAFGWARPSKAGSAVGLPGAAPAVRVVAKPAITPTSVALCVPSTAGSAVTSAGTGSCSSGTKVSLPASASAQQALISILPFLSYSSAGVDGQPTVTVSGANVQIVDGSGSTSSVNG